MTNTQNLKTWLEQKVLSKDDILDLLKQGKITYKEYTEIIGYNTITEIVVDEETGEERTITKHVLPEIPLDVLKESLIEKFRKECNQRILQGFESDCLGEPKIFDCEDYDQQYITGLLHLVTLKESIMLACQLEQREPTELELTTLNEPAKWKAKGEMICYEFSNEAVKKLALDMKKHINFHLDRFNELRLYILDENRTIEELKVVEWESELPSTSSEN